MADGSAKLSIRDYEFQEPTLRRESTLRERFSAENLTAIGKSFDLKNWNMTQKPGKILVYSGILHLLSSY